MVEIPRAVLSEQFQERMKGRRLRAAAFVTFQFDPGFFECEILPVFLDLPLGHSEKLRLVQLEDALRSLPGEIAVYYDSHGLVAGDQGSAKLDVRRIPIQHHTGIFHPKNVVLLLESDNEDEDGHRAQTLVVASLSANLTRSGWWENVEACHIEEIGEGAKTRLRDDLLAFFDSLRRKASHVGSHAALTDISRFLRTTEQRLTRSTDGALHTHFFYGRQSFPDFLEEVTSRDLRGAYLEVISPYFDEADECVPLQELVERFEPKETRVFLPRAADGSALCGPQLYQTVRQLPGTSWGHLPRDLRRLGRSDDAGERFVHAKVYRFFTQSPKRELVFVGSPNLTGAAHRTGGNLETGFLAQRATPRKPEFWLTPDERPPGDCRSDKSGESIAQSGGTPLNLRYFWDQGVAEAFWDAAHASPTLALKARSVSLGELPPLSSRNWQVLDAAITEQLAKILVETSLVDVHDPDGDVTTLLVQEEGMSHRPSLLWQLSPAEILKYWSLLTAEQRATFLSAHAPDVALLGRGADLVTSQPRVTDADTLFTGFAGMFHGFGCLERAVRSALDCEKPRDAVFRMFGRKYDSLPNLLDRVLAEDSALEDVDRYVMVLCARQLCRELAKDYPAFWQEHRDDVLALNERFTKAESIRGRLCDGHTEELTEFLEWFERRFLRRATVSAEERS
ncbi:MAG: hypothetical protein R3B13_15385 [Polyangiaceae bacterium]